MSPRVLNILCDVDIEQTGDSFHAYAVPDGIDIRPGDRVLVHDTPTVAFGEHVSCRCPATVIRGNWFARAAAHLAGWMELTELYDVGFSPKDAA